MRLEEIGPLREPGTTILQTAYKVLGRTPQPAALGWQGRRVRRVFVGREREMATLHALLAQGEDGHGQVVGIAGEPGIGKSRLLYEFCQQVRHKPYTYLAGRCVSYGQATPYLPLLDLLRQACDQTESDATDGVITSDFTAYEASFRQRWRGPRTSCGWRNASTMTFSTVWPTTEWDSPCSFVARWSRPGRTSSGHWPCTILSGTVTEIS